MTPSKLAKDRSGPAGGVLMSFQKIGLLGLSMTNPEYCPLYTYNSSISEACCTKYDKLTTAMIQSLYRIYPLIRIYLVDSTIQTLYSLVKNLLTIYRCLK